MKSSQNYILTLLAASSLTFQFSFASQTPEKMKSSHFIQNVDGRKILSNIDTTLNKLRQNEVYSSFVQEKPYIKTDSSTELYLINPRLGNVWNNTAMVFGASADGVGIGTSFVIGQPTRTSALLVTSFSVIEPFCQIPHDMVSDQISDTVDLNNIKYACYSLFILHDVAINTLTKQTTIDGRAPWKSEVKSLMYFDKKLDLAVFKIDLPINFIISQIKIETNYDLEKPAFEQGEAKLIQTQNGQQPVPAEQVGPTAPSKSTDRSQVAKIPIELFDLYMISFSTPDSVATPGMIKKIWHRGASDGTRPFETDDSVGIISAIKHDMEMTAGSSGSPLALSDGRVVGVNSNLELNQFYGKAGFFAGEKLETHISYYAIPTVFLKAFVTN